jgi:hypothetical protein
LLAPDGAALVFKDYVHIGIAVDTPQGLIAPEIRDADRKDSSTSRPRSSNSRRRRRRASLFPTIIVRSTAPTRRAFSTPIPRSCPILKCCCYDGAAWGWGAKFGPARMQPRNRECHGCFTQRKPSRRRLQWNHPAP